MIGEVVVESVGGVLVGSGWTGWGSDSPCWIDGFVGVLAGWLEGPVWGDLVEYHGRLRCW